MEDLITYKHEDLYKEHEDLHTSEDWSELQHRCSECYASLKELKEVRRVYPRSGTAIGYKAVEDKLFLDKDPRN